jgi:hypothetical protein
VIKKEAEKILKYEDLTTVIQHMCTVIAKVILVIILATGTISNHSDNTSATYQERTKLKNCKKKSCTGHCTHTMESANVKLQNIFLMQNNIICKTTCKYRTAAT